MMGPSKVHKVSPAFSLVTHSFKNNSGGHEYLIIDPKVGTTFDKNKAASFREITAFVKIILDSDVEIKEKQKILKNYEFITNKFKEKKLNWLNFLIFGLFKAYQVHQANKLIDGWVKKEKNIDFANPIFKDGLTKKRETILKKTGEENLSLSEQFVRDFDRVYQLPSLIINGEKLERTGFSHELDPSIRYYVYKSFRKAFKTNQEAFLVGEVLSQAGVWEILAKLAEDPIFGNEFSFSAQSDKFFNRELEIDAETIAFHLIGTTWVTLDAKPKFVTIEAKVIIPRTELNKNEDEIKKDGVKLQSKVKFSEIFDDYEKAKNILMPRS